MSDKLNEQAVTQDVSTWENWGEFTKIIVILPAKVKFSEEVHQIENVQTEEIGTGGNQRFERGSRFDGPPRGGPRPPYERRDNFQRDGPDSKRPAYNDRNYRSTDRFDDRRGDRFDRRNDRQFDDRRGPEGHSRYGQNDRFDERRTERSEDRQFDERKIERSEDRQFDERRNNRFNDRRNDRFGEPPRENFGANRFGSNDRFDDRRELKGDSFGGRPSYGGPDRGGYGSNPPSKSIRISSLSYDIQEDGFKDWVHHSLGNVRATGVNFIKDRATGQFKGFAFVNFDTIEESQEGLTALQQAPAPMGSRCRIDFSNSDRSRGIPPRRD